MSATKLFTYQIEMVTNTAKEDLGCKKRKVRCQKHATHVLYTLIIYWLGVNARITCILYKYTELGVHTMARQDSQAE